MTDHPIPSRVGPDGGTTPPKSWYRLSCRGWALLGVLVLFNVLNVLVPGVLESVLRNMDVRLWPGWYFGVLTVALVLSVLWYWVTSRCDTMPEADTGTTGEKGVKP